MAKETYSMDYSTGTALFVITRWVFFRVRGQSSPRRAMHACHRAAPETTPLWRSS